MIRILSFCCLLLCLGAIAVLTLDYIDPPVTDPLVFSFIKSDRYLPPGNSIDRVELYSPVKKLLADDRRAYQGILVLSGFALLSAVVLFMSSIGRNEIVEQVTPPEPPPGVSRSNSPVHGTLASRPVPDSDGGRAVLTFGKEVMTTNLNIGGMVAGGFDDSGKYLLIVSHSGRGVFETSTWLRVSRDPALAYPQAGMAVGIGPLEGVAVKVTEIDYSTEVLEFTSPDKSTRLRYSEGMLEISRL